MKHSQQSSNSTLLPLLIVPAAALCLGCGGGPYSYVPVSGTVTYEDGSVIPASSIKLVFTSLEPPVDEKTRPRPAQAGVDVTSGAFSGVTSQKPNDGLVPGKHKVTVFAFSQDGQTSKLIPQTYSNGATTPLVIDTNDAPLKILVAKP